MVVRSGDCELQCPPDLKTGVQGQRCVEDSCCQKRNDITENNDKHTFCNDVGLLENGAVEYSSKL